MADPEESAGADDDIALGDITEQTSTSCDDVNQDPEALLDTFRKEWRRELEESGGKGPHQALARSSPAGGPATGPPARSQVAQKPPRPQKPVIPARGNSGLLQGTIFEEGEEGGGGGGEGGGGGGSGKVEGSEVSVSENSNSNGISNNESNSNIGNSDDTNSGTLNGTENPGVDTRSDVEIKATELFNKAVELEQSGCLYEAIQFYRRAMTLVPDIEFRAHRHNMLERPEGIRCIRSDTEGEESVNDDDLDDEDLQDLTSRFQLLMAPAQAMCSPQFEQEAPHISCLPPEMLDRIMRWVVGSDLDIRSLEQVSRVCQGFYLLARNPEIWHKACVKIWGINTGTPGVYGSWRQMFVHRPHPRFNGCYISRTTYFRCGASNFRDQSYQPWHVVQYYRYVRFFPDGFVCMLTTPDEPVSVVSHLRTKEPGKLQVVKGMYRFNGPNVSLVLKRQSREMSNRRKGRRHIGGTTDVAETTFQIEFEIRPVKQRSHWQLVWRNYTITSTFYDGKQNVSQIEVHDSNNFPPLAFSRVKSYTTDSEKPLM
ncbi:F-box only protein 9-like isoform X2 [Penaeus japonicus]|uniref:F-box only protein 9-like isoform X2 n=1 Tax=Penaeus japonicus TaxID=27405 RepID=UPI001C717272|nr:F-box only protein 9-like isoform X2 [Penaeus japonicus]